MYKYLSQCRDFEILQSIFSDETLSLLEEEIAVYEEETYEEKDFMDKSYGGAQM